MPELPEVETVVRVIRPQLTGRRIACAQFAIARQLAPQTPPDIARALRGSRIRDVTRRGKYIRVETDRGMLLLHLRMTGRLYVRPEGKPENVYERARFELDNGRVLVFHDPRTLGTMRFFAPHEPIVPLLKIGWEPLSERVSAAALREKLARRSQAIKPVLLDQTVWAGIGNIYASEMLWEARIDPRASAARLSSARLERIIEAVPRVLQRALDRGGTTLRNFASPDGIPGAYQKEFRVYEREGEPCRRCGRPLRRIVQAQRSTYFCATCQR